MELINNRAEPNWGDVVKRMLTLFDNRVVVVEAISYPDGLLETLAQLTTIDLTSAF